jgi:hypothetical protein
MRQWWFGVFLASCSSLCEENVTTTQAPVTSPSGAADPSLGSGPIVSPASPGSDAGADARALEEEDEEVLTPKGTAVTPKVEVQFSDENEPEFHFTGLPAVSDDKKTIAYAFVDDDIGLVAGHAVVLVDVDKAKLTKTLTLSAHGELAAMVEKQQAIAREPWQKRVDAANQWLAKSQWKAIAFTHGESADEEEHEGYQAPTSIDGLRIGIPDKNKPTVFEVRDEKTTRVSQDIKPWLGGRKGRLGIFSVATDRDLGVVILKTRVVDEPYALRTLAFPRDGATAPKN